MNYIITVKVDNEVTGRIGPFDAECVADMYIDYHLIKSMPSATFCVEQLTSPSEMLNILKNVKTT